MKRVARGQRALARKGQVEVIAKAETAAARRAEELLDLIGRRIEGIAEAFYDIGAALREILRKKLYGAIGYRSFNDLLAGRKLMGRTQAAKLIEVAESMTRDQAIKLGFERSFAAARLVAATPEPDTIGDLLTSGVKTGKHGHGRKKLEAMSVREIEGAARTLRRNKEGKSEEQKAAEAAAKRARSALVREGFRVLECEVMRRSMEWLVHIEVKPK